MKDKNKASDRSLCNGYVRNHSNNETTYEHRDIAEEMLGRKLLPNEDVHHLDSNRENNSPDNLLVLDTAQHTKLHGWLDKNVIIPKPTYLIRKLKGCIRCKECDKPINDGMSFCSQQCSTINISKNAKLANVTKEELTTLIKEKSYVELGKTFGVSDVGIRKKCKTLGIELPNKRKVLLA